MSAAVPHRARPAGRLWKRLQNPFALVAEGFLLGAVLFFTFHPFAEAATVAPPVEPAVLSQATATCVEAFSLASAVAGQEFGGGGRCAKARMIGSREASEWA